MGASKPSGSANRRLAPPGSFGFRIPDRRFGSDPATLAGDVHHAVESPQFDSCVYDLRDLPMRAAPTVVRLSVLFLTCVAGACSDRPADGDQQAKKAPAAISPVTPA